MGHPLGKGFFFGGLLIRPVEGRSRPVLCQALPPVYFGEISVALLIPHCIIFPRILLKIPLAKFSSLIPLAIAPTYFFWEVPSEPKTGAYLGS